MLVITRKENQAFFIADDIQLKIVQATNGKVRIGIEAPDHITILRDDAQKARQTPQNLDPKIKKAAEVLLDLVCGVCEQKERRYAPCHPTSALFGGITAHDVFYEAPDRRRTH